MQPTQTPKSKNWFRQHKKLTIIGGIVLVFIIIAAAGGGGNTGNTTNNSSDTPKTDTNSDKAKTDNKPAQAEDLSQVSKEYTLTAGYYTAGTDLPAGTADVTAVSGTGNLSSSNIYNGGVNEMFGIDDGTGLYTSSFKGLAFPKNTTLSLNGDLVVKLTFTKVTANFSGRTYDEAGAKKLSDGNYTAGTDFPAGTYKITAVSGAGNLSSSNLYEGGVNEMFGVKDSYGFYNDQFLNAKLDSGVTLTISGGLTVKLVPSK